jgi:hypothetical protein
MLPLFFILAAMLVAQVAILVPLADFLTRKLSGDRPATRGGLPSAIQPV